MKLLNAIEQLSYVNNTKGGKYYSTTYNSNLDFFSMASRYMPFRDLIELFENAYNENNELALANLLYVLDIFEGKGERRIFKTIFKYICNKYPDDARIILSFIPKFGRYDYILEGLNTKIEDDVISLIQNQLNEDILSNNPSLLGKWLPSHRTHNTNNKTAKYLIKKLNMSEKKYRKILKELRQKINIVETNLTNKLYSNINFEQVPAKAMLKYTNSFSKNMQNEFNEYKAKLLNNTASINTKGLFCYEIVRKALQNADKTILDAMWNQQKKIPINSNILVVADTSGSMLSYDQIPYFTSLGLALYTAENNTGVFKNKFITFSNIPILQSVNGKDIFEKIRNIRTINEITDIDKVFKLILDSAKEYNISSAEMAESILIISDMEFDYGVYSENGTNFKGWRDAYNQAGYKFPNIIFWNVRGNIRGVPVTRNDNDCIMLSGFSTNALEHIFNLDNFNPNEYMIEVLEKYIALLNDIKGE